MRAFASDFHEFADLLPEALLLVAGDGIVQAANRVAADFFACSVDQLVGQQFSRFCLDDELAVADLIKASSRTKKLVPGALTIAQSDGAGLACRCEGAVYRPRFGDSPALVLLRISRKEAAVNRFVLLNQRIADLSREVAGRRSAEKALQAVSERLRVTLASIGDAVIATDAGGYVTFMNAVAERLTGWPLPHTLGRHLDDVFVIINEETRKPVESPVAKVLRLGNVVGLANHTLLVRADGSELPIDDSGAPIRGEDGALLGVVLVFHDISERHALERELLRKTHRLEEADRHKNEFLSMLAHELRNPLAALKAGVYLLDKKHGSIPDVSRVSKMLDRQLAHMARLVDDLLDVARLTRGAIEFRKRPMALAEAINHALEMTRSSFESRSLALHVEPCPAEVMVEGDLTRLVQVFTNLLSNAAKFTEPRGEVHVALRIFPNEACVEVRDTGAGMDAGLLSRIFDLFVQGDRSLDRAQGGLGIGLTVARSIAQMHEGSIEAHSDGPGRGSKFLVTLPLLVGQEPAVRRSERPDAFGTAPSRLRVLVVDDNVDAAESLCSILQAWGHDVHFAPSSQAAIDVAPHLSPQVALLDIGLPGMSGYELAKALRLIPQIAPIFLVAVTGYGDADARRRSRETGFDHHMTKPVDFEALQALLAGIPSS